LSQQFRLSLNDLEMGKEKANEIYQSVCQVTKNFVAVAKKYFLWLYVTLSNELKPEEQAIGLKFEYIVESVLYGLIFEESDSILYKLIIKVLKIKYAELIERLGEALRNFVLEEDKDLEEKYKELYKDFPFEEISKNIQRNKDNKNPFKKFDELIYLEKEIINIMCAKNTKLTEKDLQENWKNLEIKSYVFSSCLVRSKDPEIILDILFIETFIHPQSFMENNKSADFEVLKTIVNLFIPDDVASMLPQAQIADNEQIRIDLSEQN